MEPRFSEVPRDWGNLFLKSKVRYIEHFHLTNFRENYQNVRYIEVRGVLPGILRGGVPPRSSNSDPVSDQKNVIFSTHFHTRPLKSIFLLRPGL